MLRTLLLSAFVALAFAGCGNKHDIVTVAETEGIYVDVAGLTYQVQMSRYLNPGDPEDIEYLRGLPTGTSPELPGDETWFGVWMRVKNYSGGPLTTADEFTIVDTEGDEFKPVELDTEVNVFAYEPTLLQHSQVLPMPDTAAASGPIQGSLILFKLTADALQNRPLKLMIEQAGQEAEVDLDL